MAIDEATWERINIRVSYKDEKGYPKRDKKGNLKLNPLFKENIKSLESLIEQNPHWNSNDVIVDRLFGNALRWMTDKHPDIQKSYFDLALHYFEKYPINLQDVDTIPNICGRLSRVYTHLFVEHKLPATLGKSKIYHEIAKKIIDFYLDNKDNIGLLAEVSETLSSTYAFLHLFTEGVVTEEYLTENYPIIKSVVQENGMDILKDTQIVKKIWEKAKEIYAK